MGKQDRYDFEGADDSLGDDGERSDASTGAEPESADDTAATTGVTGDAGNTDASPTTPLTAESDSDTDPDAVPPATPEPKDFAGSSNEVPHRVRYDSPKDGRTTKTFYLDKERDLARLRDLHSLAESEFDEKVHQLDVYLAAFRSDLSDDSFLLEMRRIGYGYFD